MVAQIDAISPDGAVLSASEWPDARALRGDFVRNLEITFLRRGTEHSVIAEVTTAPLPSATGSPLQIVVTSHDITERKRAGPAIKEIQERLENVVDNLAEGLIIYGLNESDVRWNRAALAMIDVTRDQVEGPEFEQLMRSFELRTLTGDVLPFESWPISRLRRGEAMPETDLIVRHIDRNWERTLRFRGAVVRDASGKPLVFITFSDVTAHNAAELQLQLLNTELEQRVTLRTSELQAKTHELESFCYSVSHDLKAPLRGIDGYSRLLADGYGDKLDADGHMFIDNVRRAAAQMNTMIEDLLAYSQQERRTFVGAPIHLKAFVDEHVARHAIELNGIRLTVNVDDVCVNADREGLKIALRNLIDNAIKFSTHSDPPVVDISGACNADRCVLSVRDNGVGFEMRHYSKIFEIFQRLHRAEDYPGTGIGLALVRKAMERMGGRVWAESKPGEGATFYLDLPLADKTGAADTDK